MLMALAIVVVVSIAAAPPVTTYPKEFSNRERMVTVGTVTGHGISRRNVQRGTNVDTLVFDSATQLHFVDQTAPGGALTATWRCPARRVVVFTWTPDMVDEFRNEVGAGLPFTVNVKVGNGRLNFGRAGGRYAGTQILRVSGRYQGYLISVVETITFTGSGTPGKTDAPANGVTTDAALGELVERVTARLRLASQHVAR
jgi:hypothetical protein